ncbi:hypothetical protein [Ottowia sp. VDI28]|uniref:hypothetical protein n=1 Tax=Ottowia sp. VDI28 TaxID=3133968 RepID=UPI003C300666
MSSDLKDSEHAALVRVLYRQSRAVLFANFVIPIPVIAVLWSYGSQVVLLAWAGLVYLVGLARLALGFAHARHALPAQSSEWAWRFTIGSSVSSALWGWIGWGLYLPEQPQLVAFICIVITGLSCGTIASFAAFPPLLPWRRFCSSCRSRRAISRWEKGWHRSMACSPFACSASICTTAASPTAPCAKACASGSRMRRWLIN